MLEVLGATRGGRRADCLRAASFRADHGRAGVARVARAGVLRRCAGALRRCPTDAIVPVGSFGAVLQTLVSRRGPAASSSFGPREVIAFHVSLGSLGHDWGRSVETAWKPLWVGHGNLMETTWKPHGNRVETTWILKCDDFEPKRNSCRMGAKQDPCRYPCQIHWVLGPGFMASISRIPEARRFRRCPVGDEDRPTTTTIDDGDDSRPTTSTIDGDGRLIDDRRTGVVHHRVRAQSVRLSMGGARDRAGATQRSPRRVPRGSRAGRPSEHGMLENERRKFPCVGAARPPTLTHARRAAPRRARPLQPSAKLK